jgi:NADH:ubiquinone reductase (non-electrogenic)
LNAIKGKGRGTYFLWRSAYFTRLMGWKNKFLVLFDWLKTGFFGRDISGF